MRENSRLFLLPILLLLLLTTPVVADEATAATKTTDAPAEAMDMTVDQLIEKNIEAKGGREAIQKVQSMRATGTINMAAMGAEAPLTIEIKRPGMVRVETEMQGVTIVQAHDGEKGWYIMPMLGTNDPQEMDEQQSKQVIDMADLDGPLMDYEDKGHTVELLGKEELEGTDAYRLKLTKKDGDVVTIYLDAEYFLDLRQIAKVDMQGTEVEGTTVIGDYKEVGDLVLAHSMEQSFGGPTMVTITLENVELNPELSDDRFAMPAVEKPAAEKGEKSGE